MATLPTDLLQNFSDEALMDELKRRENASVPLIQVQFSPSPIIRACRDYIEYLAADEFSDDERADCKNHIYEVAMEAVYGKDIWSWINERLGR